MTKNGKNKNSKFGREFGECLNKSHVQVGCRGATPLCILIFKGELLYTFPTNKKTDQHQAHPIATYTYTLRTTGLLIAWPKN